MGLWELIKDHQTVTSVSTKPNPTPADNDACLTTQLWPMESPFVTGTQADLDAAQYTFEAEAGNKNIYYRFAADAEQ